MYSQPKRRPMHIAKGRVNPVSLYEAAWKVWTKIIRTDTGRNHPCYLCTEKTPGIETVILKTQQQAEDDSAFVF